MDKKKVIKEILIYGTIFILFAVIIPRFVLGTTVVEGRSMEETLNPGDWLLNQKVTYYFKDPERFDIVLLWSPHDSQEQWVKRVIGLPGEVIQIKKGKVFIDGEELSEDIYGNGLIDYEGIAKEPYEIPKDSYFVIGDNRMKDISWDSRYEENGPVEREDIIAKIILRTWPFSKAGFIK